MNCPGWKKKTKSVCLRIIPCCAVWFALMSRRKSVSRQSGGRRRVGLLINKHSNADPRRPLHFIWEGPCSLDAVVPPLCSTDSHCTCRPSRPGPAFASANGAFQTSTPGKYKIIDDYSLPDALLIYSVDTPAASSLCSRPYSRVVVQRSGFATSCNPVAHTAPDPPAQSRHRFA